MYFFALINIITKIYVFNVYNTFKILLKFGVWLNMRNSWLWRYMIPLETTKLRMIHSSGKFPLIMCVYGWQPYFHCLFISRYIKRRIFWIGV